MTRPGTPVDAIDGVIPKTVVEPATAEEVGATLQRASRDKLAVVVRGRPLHHDEPPGFWSGRGERRQSGKQRGHVSVRGSVVLAHPRRIEAQCLREPDELEGRRPEARYTF